MKKTYILEVTVIDEDGAGGNLDEMVTKIEDLILENIQDELEAEVNPLQYTEDHR